MAYTGTGTEQDPYVVTTLTELVALMGNDIYIKIGADIDASQEDAYKEPVASYVSLRGHIYADGIKTISNVIVEYLNAIYIENCDIKNIFFKNWIHRKTGSGESVNTMRSTIKNCSFSMEMVDDGNGFDLLGKSSSFNSPSNVENCTFYVKFTSGTTGLIASANVLKYVNVDKCTFMFENLKCSHLSLAGSGSKVDNCAFIGNITISTTTDNTITPFTNDSTYTKSKIIFALNISSDTNFKLFFGSYVRYVMVDKDVLSENISISFGDSTCRALTTGQIQSQQYLEDIGFLP
ncbi:MAG: hypothetical protein IJJ69_14085 [Oscillospiraceae bacterium]|nr:hypothetical protein [Oscillospiraceae bacterium]